MNSSRNGLILITFILYSLLAFAFAVSAPELIIYILGAIAILSSFVLMLNNYVGSLYPIVLVTHIGPIIRVDISKIGIITLGDLYIVMLLAVFIIRIIKNKLPPIPYIQIFLAMTALSLVTFIMAADVWVSIPGIINLIQISIIYFIVYSEIKTTKDADGMLISIGIGVLISAVLHLIFYSRGESLALSGQDSGQISALLGELLSPDYIRTAFFYVSFHASSTIAIVLGLRYSMRLSERNSPLVFFWFVVVVFALCSSLVSSSKTTILTAGIIILYSLFDSKFKNRFFIINITLIAIALIIFNMIVSSQQLEILKDSLLSDSAISMSERIIMWHDFFQKILFYPKELFFGLGTGLTERVPNNEAVKSIMFISNLNFQPFSFHNYYIDIIVQHGIFFFLCFLFIIYTTMVRIKSIYKKGNILAGDIYYAILAWLIVWMTHATGWSKPVIILSILFGLAHYLIKNDRLKIIKND
jgi:hypothetical protein